MWLDRKFRQMALHSTLVVAKPAAPDADPQGSFCLLRAWLPPEQWTTADPWVGCDTPVEGDETVGGGAVGCSDWPVVAVAEAEPVGSGVSVGDAAVGLSKGVSSRAGGESSILGGGAPPAAVDLALGLCSPAGGEF